MSGPLSVYVHIPFCTVKCGYCDFNAYAGMDALKSSYTKALVREVSLLPLDLRSRPVGTIAFGGGTPGELDPADIRSVLQAVTAHFSVTKGAEISLEANPGTTSGRQLDELRTAGVTRISFGAQSFDPSELAFLDRIHSPEAIGASVRLARAAGFESIGLDLMYGLPGQTTDGWKQNLVSAVALTPNHLSTYGLTVEPGTPLASRVTSGAVTVPDDDASAEMYEFTDTVLGPAGFVQYELSNWAQPGHHSRHNSVYWTDGDYLGIGAGAHGYLDGERYENVAHPRRYIAALNLASEHGWPARLSAYRPSLGVAMSDFISLRLRLLDGLAASAFAERFGTSLSAACGAVLDRCVAAGVIEAVTGWVRLTRRGRLLHGEVAAQLLEHLSSVS